MSNALNSIYNNYLSAYAPPSVTKYDTHKKSELRNIYNSIVKINKESPWYLPLKSADAQTYAINLKENARELHNTIVALGGMQNSEDDLLSKKAASSTNSEIATATYLGSETSFEESPSFVLDIKALAQSQENRGQYLQDKPVTLPADTYSFDVQINEMNYEFQFSISEGETNKEVQNRLARLINNSNIGLNAHLDETEDASSLIISSDTTGLSPGKDFIFSISDDHTSKSRGAVEYLGLDYVSRQASNSELTVNGEPFSTQSNDFTVGKLFEVSIKSTTPPDQPVTIALKTDIESLTDNITGLAAGYNKFLQQTMAHFEDQPRSKSLYREVSNLRNLYSSAFQSIGLTTNEDGSLNLDTKKLEETITTSDDLNETFLPLKDFSKKLLQKSDQISLNPMTYVDKKVVAYKNPAGPNYASPYITSAYSGMMFNGYC